MRYNVQILVVRECEVEADDDLQAEREAYNALREGDRGSASAIQVLERIDDTEGGALRSEDPADCWKFAKDNFDAIDAEWVSA